MVAALAASSMVARSKPSRLTAQPSPICGYTCGVPMTSWARRAQAYASSLVPRAPPSTAIDPAPPAAFASVISSAARASAAFHVVGCSSSSTRTSGAVEAVVAVDGLEVEPAPVAQPAPVDRVAVDALVAQQLVAARLHDRAAADGARGAGALGLLEVPRAGLEPVRLGGERADRADLHRVAAEVAGERLVGERRDLRVVAAAG